MISQPTQLMNLTKALESAIEDLEQLAKKKSPHPSRFHARDILVPLGTLAAADLPFPRDELVTRLTRLTEPFAERWQRAVNEELQLACAEFVTSVDEHYLELDNYDFDYTTTARERLGARLLACELLSCEVAPKLTEQIERADLIYAPYREKYEKGRG